MEEVLVDAIENDTPQQAEEPVPVIDVREAELQAYRSR
mgnify:CR=1 FL=1